MRAKIAAAALALLLGAAPVLADEAADAARLQAAFTKLVEAFAKSGQSVTASPYWSDPANRASGMAFVTSMMIRTLEEDVVQDVDFPSFRILDPRIREGGDNPDQRYLFARIQGGATYRVWGTLGGARRLEFQIYAGDPYVQGGGRSVSFLTFENIRFGKDGSFELFLSPEKMAGKNWMENAADSTKLMVRQVYSDWHKETGGEVHIDRVGYEGRLRPVTTPLQMAEKLEKAARDLEMIVGVWPAFVRARYQNALVPNTMLEPSDPGAVGGVAGRWMSGGFFDLKADEALIVTTYPTDANYQGIQLTDPWFSSLEYANRQSSLTTDQAYLSPDGAYRFVLAGSDPGIQNWLDTTGLAQGTILLRFDGSSYKSFPREKFPKAEKVKLSELKAHLPADTPSYSAAQRAAELAARRRHVQTRFGF